MDPGAYCRLELTLPPIEITIASRKAYAPAEVVPEGRNESSPVRSAGLAFRKTDPSRPVRRSQDAIFALRATARRQREGRTIAKRRPDEGGIGRSTGVHAREPGSDRPGAEHFDRRWRNGHLLLPHFPALRAGLLSLSPFGTTSAHPRLREPITPMTNEQPRNTYVTSCFRYRPTSLGYLSY
jgi:hypothetical protein